MALVNSSSELYLVASNEALLYPSLLEAQACAAEYKRRGLGHMARPAFLTWARKAASFFLFWGEWGTAAEEALVAFEAEAAVNPDDHTPEVLRARADSFRAQLRKDRRL